LQFIDRIQTFPYLDNLFGIEVVETAGLGCLVHFGPFLGRRG
jgi:hypothetical protein